MKRLCLALAVGVLLLLVTGVGTATASPPAFQDSGQLAGSDQDAGAAAGTAQQEPSNSNTSVRILSPGDGGDVSQTNEATSHATAANLNATDQSADQTQSGGGLQVIGQKAENDQDAFGLALTAQEGASNENAPVSVLGKDGDGGGDVTQENTASSDATAGNINVTDQDADQTQAGGSCCASGGEQLIGQEADSDQDATAIAATEQVKPSNTNVSVRVLSPGDDGDVTQSNTASSDATAVNLNATDQSADQEQSGGSCKCSHGGTQIVGQKADSEQDATALAATKQEKPSNTNVSVRVLSPGDDGDVTQTNEASSTATAANLGVTEQDADQTQAGGSGEQLIGQSAKNDQKALAGALTVQKDASNENISIRVLSPGKGGSVTQSNTASSNAEAANLNSTKQTADQTQGGDDCRCKSSGGGEQVIGQSAKNDQHATALAATVQEKPSNSNHAIRVGSKGDDGDVTQTNDASSNATAVNLNATKQDADQTQRGPGCGCKDGGLQAIGQEAKNEQDAFAAGLTLQHGASNENAPVRVLSKGDDGDVTQTNDASSNATAANLNAAEQDADQTQGGSGLQAIGQSAKNDQDAFALGLTLQTGASNENAPVRVLSKGDGGDVTQTNTASSNALAANLNFADQDATQTQGGSTSKGCCGAGIQAVGQLAENEQGAVALSFTAQLGGKGKKQPCVCGEKGSVGNSNAPIRVSSPGDDGSVSQENVATSSAIATNWNVVKQTVQEIQAAPCVCREPAIQAVGQLDDSSQFAVAGAGTLQTQPKKKSAHDLAGSGSRTDQSKQKVER